MTPQYTKRLASRLMKDRLMLPKQSAGKIRIEHKHVAAGTELPITNYREAMFSGIPIANLLLKEDTTIHRMVDDDAGVWMSDLPCELLQMHRDLAVHAHGRVLIGGLGLGIVTKMTLARPSVTEVVVVEQNPDVIALIASYCHRDDLKRKLTIQEGNIHKYAKCGFKHDVALLDTWQRTGEWPWQSEVVPLRRALSKSCRHVYCWAEQTMLGQVWQGILQAAEVCSEDLYFRGSCHYYAFRQALIAEGFRKESISIRANDIQARWAAEEANKNDWELKMFARSFLLNVGTPVWEKTFGAFWDEAWEKQFKESNEKQRAV